MKLSKWRGTKRGIGVASATILSVFAVLLMAPQAFAATTITGGGSGFAGLEVQQWQADVQSAPYNLTVNYQSTSSSQGRVNFANGTWDYGASDIPYPASEQPAVQQLQSGRCHGATGAACWNYVTVAAGGLSFMYNLQSNSGARIQDLKLTPDEICKIFTGVITSWHDPELVATNPELGSFDPSRNIQVITRADGAGESYVLSEFCIAVDPVVWQNFVTQTQQVVLPATGETIQDSQDFFAGVPISYWPEYLAQSQNTIQVSGADGTADAVVSGTDGVDSITYVAAGYALVRSFPVASVQNAAGVFTQPNATSVNVALGYATPRGDGTFNLNFAGPDPRAYFPSTYSYVLAQSAGLDPGKGSTLGQFLCYAIGKGQQYAARLLYAPLSSAVVAISKAAIAKIPGAPTQSVCAAGAPPPPPPPVVVPVGTKKSTGGSHPGAGSTSQSSVTTATGSGKVSALSSPTSNHTAASSAAGTVAGIAGASGRATTNGALSNPGATSQSAAGVVGSSPYQLATQSPGPTNSEALWSVLEGAGVCALGLTFASRSRRRSR